MKDEDREITTGSTTCSDILNQTMIITNTINGRDRNVEN